MKRTITSTKLINCIHEELLKVVSKYQGMLWKDDKRALTFQELLQVYKSQCFDYDLLYKVLNNDGHSTLVVEVSLDYGSIIFMHLYRCGKMLINAHVTANDWVLNLYEVYISINDIDFLNDEEVYELQKENQKLLNENKELKRKLNLYLSADLRKKLMDYLKELDEIGGVKEDNGN